MSFELDQALARSLQDQFDSEGVQVVGETRSKSQESIVDEHWELTDPNPDIHQLFVGFDSRFFWGKLASSGVAVDWSKRMTL